jgi:four helix bundle protein
MESDDATHLVSSNEKCGLSARVGLSTDGVLHACRNPTTDCGGQMAKIISSFKELRAYQEAVRLQEMVFEESKHWPKEELYALTSQIRRSSRAIGAAMAEAWAKRRYPAHFLSKMTDADAELQESQHWIETAYASGYLSGESKESFILLSQEIGRLIGGMMAKHESFCRSSSPAEKK